MHRSSQTAQFLVVTIVVATLAGCSGAAISSLSPTNLGPSVSKSFTSRPAKKAGGEVAFVSDSNNNAVYVIRQGQLSETLNVDGPEGVAVDTAHNLYVANVAGSNILVYAPPYNGTPRALEDPGFRPNGVALDAKGNVAVTSFESNTYGLGSIAFYTKGATSPTKIILADSTFAGDYYCAFDASGNLYLDSKNGSGPFEAGEVVGGIDGKRVKPLTTGNLLQYPGGMQVTKSGKIAILDQSEGSGTPTIYTYNPPSHGSFGNPIATTLLASANDAVAFAFEDRNDRFVFTADTYFTSPKAKHVKSDHEDQIGQTQSFNYPGGGMVTSVRLPDNAILVGVALNPPESP
jgi:sugar lactone lactonase YvrE